MKHSNIPFKIFSPENLQEFFPLLQEVTPTTNEYPASFYNEEAGMILLIKQREYLKKLKEGSLQCKSKKELQTLLNELESDPALFSEYLREERAKEENFEQVHAFFYIVLSEAWYSMLLKFIDRAKTLTDTI